MGYVGIHKKGELSLSELLKSVKERADFHKAGAIAMFIGVVRSETVGGENVERLELEAYEERANKILGKICEELKKREGIVIFPEGTYYHNVMGPGQVGMVKFILSRLSLPFIPVGIGYTRHNWRFLVRIQFGKKFHADAGVSVNTFIDHMMGEIAELSGLSSRIKL